MTSELKQIDFNFIYNYISVLALVSIRFATAFSVMKSIRGILGMSGVSILSLCFSFYSIGTNLSLSVLNNTKTFFYILLTKEILIGLFIGLSMSLVFELIPFCGRLFDTFRGVQFAEQMAPEMGPRDSELEVFGGYLTLALFFSPQIFPYFIEYLFKINKYCGVLSEQENNIMLFEGLKINASTMYGFIGQIFITAIFVTLPLVVLSMMLEIGFSIISKVSPKFQIGLDLGYLRAGAGVFILFAVILNGETAEQLLVKYISSYIYSLQSILKV